MRQAMTPHSSRRVRPRVVNAPAATPPATAIGTIVEISPHGEPVVACGCLAAPVASQFLAGAWPTDMPLMELVARQVLLAFDDSDAHRPIIIGLLADGTKPHAEVARVKGEQVDLHADKEITLRCGKSSITLRQDGKIIIRGTHLLSRATGPIRIKGGHVEIN